MFPISLRFFREDWLRSNQVTIDAKGNIKPKAPSEARKKVLTQALHKKVDRLTLSIICLSPL